MRIIMHMTTIITQVCKYIFAIRQDIIITHQVRSGLKQETCRQNTDLINMTELLCGLRITNHIQNTSNIGKNIAHLLIIVLMLTGMRKNGITIKNSMRITGKEIDYSRIAEKISSGLNSDTAVSLPRMSTHMILSGCDKLTFRSM